MHKIVTATKPVEQRSPFMALPPELRLIIYDFALQDTISAIESTSFRHIPPSKNARLPILGALALLFTSSEVRTESSNAMRTSCGVLVSWASTQHDSYITQPGHGAVVHGRPVISMDGLNDLSRRSHLMARVRLIILRAYTDSRREMQKRSRRS
jgi:hypothetical protein